VKAFFSKVLDFYQLTKPSIVLLVAVTGICAMAAEGSLFNDPVQMLLILFAIVLSAGSANALNQFIDRDIDAVMDRTRSKRPLPLASIRPFEALVFGISLGVLANWYLWVAANPLTSIISISTILFYIFVYTLWLKRRHHYNIVIGGAAGATAPLIASAAFYDQPSVLSWFLFTIIFFWTPPHFWALALAIKDQYAKVKIPMLPNILGDARTRREIFWYTIFLLPLTVAPYFLKLVGPIYLLAVVVLWAWYMRETVVRLRVQTISAYKKLFLVSIGYLFFLFMAAGIDGAVRFYYGS